MSFWVQITLCVPWLAPQDQALVFPNGITFQRPEQQEEYVREWARKRTGLPCDFKIKFYPGRYAVEKCSILPVGDPTSYIPDNEVALPVHPLSRSSLSPSTLYAFAACKNM